MKAVAAATLIAALGAAASAQEAEPKRVLVFGDSLTWGWVPTEPVTPTTRHPMEDRWTTAMAEALGEGYEIVVEG